MRKARIKITHLTAVYHCISRIVGEEYLLDDDCKETFRCYMWQQAEFAGLQILTYCLMTNHIHILLRVPAPSENPGAPSQADGRCLGVHEGAQATVQPVV